MGVINIPILPQIQLVLQLCYASLPPSLLTLCLPARSPPSFLSRAASDDEEDEDR